MLTKCLGSSSSGNCYLLTFATPDGDYKTTIMIECGISKKEIMKRALINNANEDLINIKAILVTHNHSDHCCSLQSFNGLSKVYASKEVLEKFNGLLLKQEITANNDYCIAHDLFITTFNVEHDAPNSLGFIIFCKRTNERVLFINDCKYIKADLTKYKFDYIFIECNYLDKQVRTLYHQAQVNNDRLVMFQYKRVIDVHMSLAIFKKVIKNLNLEKCKAIFLMHLSDRHANEYLMKNEINEVAKCSVYVCQKGGGIK